MSQTTCLPEEIQLGQRALAAGAPPLGTHTVYLDARIMDAHTGLVYIRADDSGELLHKATVPLLADPSWVGWVQTEVRRRGYLWAMTNIDHDGEGWSIKVHRRHESAAWFPCLSRADALLAMLEAAPVNSPSMRFTIGSGSAGAPGADSMTVLKLPPFISGVIKVS